MLYYHDVIWQTIRADLAWTETLQRGYSVDNESLLSELVYWEIIEFIMTMCVCLTNASFCSKQVCQHPILSIWIPAKWHSSKLKLLLKSKSQIMYKSKENMMRQLMMIQKNESALQADFGKRKEMFKEVIWSRLSYHYPRKAIFH